MEEGEQDSFIESQRVLERSLSPRSTTLRRFLLCSVTALFFLLVVAKLNNVLRTKDGETREGDVEEDGLYGSSTGLLEGEFNNQAVGNCTASAWAELIPGTYEHLMKEANCGSGYSLDSARDDKPYKVFLLGETLGRTLRLTGCKLGSHCPLNPKCQMVWSKSYTSPHSRDANVIMVTNFEGVDYMQRAVQRNHHPKQVVRVLQWREAYWPYITPDEQKREFDLTSGVFLQADLISPFYLRRPHTLLHPRLKFDFLPFDQRTEFGLSIISNCNAKSKRKTYLNFLKDYLGDERVHQYGTCGDRELPPPPINRARKVIARYKFYFSFENTLSTGYVSEKLFTVLNLNLVPVYMGGNRNVVNITTLPSMINVYDFATPQKLAEYLMFLDSNPDEYAKYHAWRTADEPFTREYLELVKNKFPGQEELRLYGRERMSNRAAVCCRLCNQQYTAQLQKQRDMPIYRDLDVDEINKQLFAGGMFKRPGPEQMIAPPKIPSPPLSEEDFDLGPSSNTADDEEEEEDV